MTKIVIAAAAAIVLLSAAAAPAQERTAAQMKAEAQAKLDAFPHKDTLEASVHRGTIVYANYCVTCHGVNADGNGRAAKMYTPKPANLRASMMPDAYKDGVIRRGGKAMGRSEFMPPWGEELTNEQIADSVNYLRAIAPPNAPK
jgi:mono/diheme cytochrome c family protein